MRLLKMMLFLGGAMSLVVVLGQLALVAMLWRQGSLSARTIAEIRLALAGQPALEVAVVDVAEGPPAISADEVQDARVLRVLNLEIREKELDVVKEAVAAAMNQLIQDREALDQLKKKFTNELLAQSKQRQSEATDQTRAVLLASPPEVAASRLMELSLEESVVLMRGMPEKQIAKILQQFVGTPDKEKRGREIFESLAQGEPDQTLINSTRQALSPNGNGAGGL
ncbi:MAG: hypothetical protein C0478_07270 [Planctomyces sp.]|nr:hypothetical protein [Planctomyces sp.]